MVRTFGEFVVAENKVAEFARWWCINYPLPFHFLINASSRIAPPTQNAPAHRRVATALLVGLQGLKSHIMRCPRETFYCLEEAEKVSESLPPGKRDAFLRATLSPKDLKKFDQASEAITEFSEREEVRNTIAFLARVIRGKPN